MPWQCFVVRETGMQRAWLRRFVWSSKGDRCTAMPGEMSYHHAKAPVEDVPLVLTREHFVAATPVANYEGDPRWPTHCECGYEFSDDDNWQVLTRQLFARVDGEPGEWEMHDLPAGALFESPWLGEGWIGPDGRKLSAMCPPGGEAGHIWHMDGPATGGGRWARQGGLEDLAGLTVSPSILTPTYHGFLQGGRFTDSLQDRPLPPGPVQP